LNGKTIGIKDVAAAAGVSVTTVSQVLNEVASARISPETRDKVRSVAGQLGYGPNSVARALRTNRTALLGLVIEDAGANPHTGQIILGADRAARARGYNLLVVNTSGSAGAETRDADVESLLARRVDGVLYAPRHPGQLPLPASIGSTPVVTLNTVGSGSSVTAVVSDHDDGARAAVDEPAEPGGLAGLAGLAARAAGLLIDAIEGGTGANLPAGPEEAPAYTPVARGSVAPPHRAATPRGNF
jgi:LacI family transcriptional regulator